MSMLREVIDIASLEDFASGLARAARLRVCVYDAHGDLIVASAADNDFALLTRHVLDRLPANLPMTAVPAHDPPALVAYVESRGIWYVVAPVLADDQRAGYVGLGEFRESPPPLEAWPLPPATSGIDHTMLQRAWEKLPRLDRGGHAHAVITARWAARQLSEWGRREARLLAATDEVALVGDIAELLTGQQDLQKVLNRIVAAYLEFAELQALNRKPMYMKDWIVKLDDYLRLSDRDILTHAGTVSHEEAIQKAELEFEKYRHQQLAKPSQVEKDFENAVKKLPKPKKGH